MTILLYLNGRGVLSAGFVLSAFVCMAEEPAPPERYVPGRLLVRAHRNQNPHEIRQVVSVMGGRHHRDLAGAGVDTVEVPERAIEQVAHALRHSGKFEFVERDGIASPAVAPNDPSFPAQWHLPKIQAPEAWSLTTGSMAQTIAVVDSGVDPNHPDLISRLVPGWNFIANNDNTADRNGHGTWVAGAAAAAGNNLVGGSGVNWNTRIMPLVAMNTRNYAPYSAIAAAIRYAASRGARIITISLGGTTASSTLQSAIDYAWARGAVVFAAAMNTGSSTRYYPAACNNVVAVAATDRYDARASFSNFGNWIDLASPGVSILTTALAGGYTYVSGTSLATPVAAGVGALALAAKPTLTAAKLVAVLQSSTDNLGTASYDVYYGYGRVNAFKAVQQARATY